MNIPPELENMLLEFTVNAIAENPSDCVSFAADYFTRLRDQRNERTVTISDDISDIDEDSREYVERALGRKALQRRGTVMGERYNPEEDAEEEDDEALEITPKTDDERRKIKQQTKDFFLFRVLDDADLNDLIDAMTPKQVSQGEVIIQEGDDGDFFYLIDSGDFDIFISDNGEEKQCGKYEGKGFFGELALLYNQPRAATIKAASDGSLWAVSRKTFNRLIVKRAFEKRQMYVKLLEGVDALKPLTEYEKMQVADALIAKSYNKGEVIVNEGDEGDGMYFLVEGLVSVRKRTTGEEYEELNQLSTNAFFGEMALLKHQPRAATVVAVEDTKAAFLEVEAFERLLGPCREIMHRHVETYKKSDVET